MPKIQGKLAEYHVPRRAIPEKYVAGGKTYFMTCFLWYTIKNIDTLGWWYPFQKLDPPPRTFCPD